MTSTSISDAEFDQLLETFGHEAIHLETRDAYGTEIELPHMAKWARGEPDDLGWLQGWADILREHMKAGRSIRRVRVVSEPLSDYQRWSHSIAHVMVDAGEDIRGVPRKLASAILLPGNDFYAFDDRIVVFLHYAGNGLIIDKTTSTDPSVIEQCRAAFEDLWRFAIPHREFPLQ